MPDLSDIKLIVFDVDGVLTDGSILIDDHGVETKRFHVRDGFALRAAIEAGVKVGIVTGRASRAVSLRMAELGIDLVLQGASNKLAGFETICQRAGVLPEQAAYVGDDLMDLPPMVSSGYAVAVADAVELVREAAQFITASPGGRGAAREAVEHILRAQNRWDAVLDRYSL